MSSTEQQSKSRRAGASARDLPAAARRAATAGHRVPGLPGSADRPRMPRLLHRKRRAGTVPTCSASPDAAANAGAVALVGTPSVTESPRPVTLKVVGGIGATSVDISVPGGVGGRGGAGAASAAGEILAAVWDLPPLGGHEGAASEIRDELCRLAAVAVEQRRREEALDIRQKKIERLEAEHRESKNQKQHNREDNTNRQLLQEQLKVALARIDKLTKDLNKLNELEEDFRKQIINLETLAKQRERGEAEHRFKLETLETARQKWQEKEAEYLRKIEELRTNEETKLEAVRENMRNEMSQLQNECNTRGEHITNLETKVANLEVANERLQETARNLQEKISILEQESDELRAHIDNLERVHQEPSEEVQVSTQKVEALEHLDRHSEIVINDLRQAVSELEAADTAKNEVNANLNARVEAAELEALGAAALRERLIEILDDMALLPDALQNDGDIPSTVTSVFNKFKTEEENFRERIEQLQQRVNELESNKHEAEELNYYQSQQIEVTDSNARVEAAELEALGAAALRERLMEILNDMSLPQDALQNNVDILSAVTSVFNKFKIEEGNYQERIEQLQQRINQLESNKHEAEELNYYQSQQIEVTDSTTKEMIDSLQGQLAQSQASEQEARSMLEELQAKLHYLESAEHQEKDMLFDIQSKASFPEQAMPKTYLQIEQPPEHPSLFQHPDELLPHPIELPHPYLHQHFHPNPLQFHVQYPPDFGFQLNRKDVTSRHHLPSLQPMQPIQTIQPLQSLQSLQPLPVPIPLPQQSHIGKGAKKKQRQCFKCQQFGHLAKDCDGETTCVVCGVRGHTHNECNNNETRCANCHGPHRASSKTCPVRINWCANASREAEAQQAQ